MMRAWERFEAGAEAAEEIADALGIPLAKAAPRILSGPGYEQVVRALIRSIARDTRGADRAAMQAAARKLDREWSGMSEAERARVIASAAKAIVGVPELVIGKVTNTLSKTMTEIVRVTKREVARVHRLQVNPAFNAKDERIIRFAAESQGNYITTKYRERAHAFEQRARDIVSKGLDRGLGRKDIGQLLQDRLIDPSLRTSEAYWETVAAAHTTRSRSWGQLAGFGDAGIESFQFEAVLDEVTTDQCRFMHGRTFSVAKAVESFERVAESKDDEAVKKFQPWLRIGQNADGDRVMFVQQGAKRRVVAEVESSGVGTSDKIGSYRSKLSSGSLQGLGLGTPPLHGRCRSTIVPV